MITSGVKTIINNHLIINNMNTETLMKMKQMKFLGMARAFQTSLETDNMQKLTTDELIAFLVNSEMDDRHNRAIDRRIKQAKFRYKADIENIIYENDRNLDKNQILRFADCTFIEKKENMLITGLTGIGKSYIASAIGHQACVIGYKVFYANTAKLFARLKMTKADGSYLKEISRIERMDLLILDDFGLQPFDNQARMILMEIIEDRHEKRSLIINSQIPVGKWHEVIGDNTVADAILDRIIHTAHRVDLKGESMRKKRSMKQSVESSSRPTASLHSQHTFSNQ
jgi:DNA replication protein DnaC